MPIVPNPDDNAIDAYPPAHPRDLKSSVRNKLILALARKDRECEGSTEIDDDAEVSEGDDNGAYVQAWVWVEFDGTPLDKEAE